MGLITSSFVADMSSGFTCNIGQKMPDNRAYDQFTEISDAETEYPNKLGYDKCIASPRRTATAPNEFITYQEQVFPPLSSPNLEVFEKLYHYAYAYMESLSGPTTGVFPTVFGANQIVLSYLRQRHYGGNAWTLVAGVIEEGFNAFLAENHSNELELLEPNNIFIVDPFLNMEIEVSHFAATLGALIFYVAVIDTPLDKYVDAFAGWAGDLLQVGGVIGESLELGGENDIKDLDKLYKCFGYVEGELNSFQFLYKNEAGEIKTRTDSGFSYVDLVQDLDAYNISHLYSLNTMPIHHVLDSYYNIKKSVNHRYSIFEQQLVNEFNETTILDVAQKFSCLETLPAKALNLFFQKMFGSFNNALYGENVAKAFSEKLAYFKSVEPEE